MLVFPGKLPVCFHVSIILENQFLPSSLFYFSDGKWLKKSRNDSMVKELLYKRGLWILVETIQTYISWITQRLDESDFQDLCSEHAETTRNDHAHKKNSKIY